MHPYCEHMNAYIYIYDVYTYIYIYAHDLHTYRLRSAVQQTRQFVALNDAYQIHPVVHNVRSILIPISTVLNQHCA